jgi:predicted secreted Zn-dependent protease
LVLRSRVSLNLFVGALCALSLLAPGVARSAAGPGVHVERRVEYYELPGSTLAELRRAWNARLASGVDWAGRTEGSIRFTVPEDGRGGCRLGDARVYLTLTVVLPNLAPGVRLSAGDSQPWRNLENVIADHEEEHVRIAKDGAERILRAIQNSRCSAWRSDAAAEFKALEARQKAFDLESARGRRRLVEHLDPSTPAGDLNGHPVEWTVQAE